MKRLAVGALFVSLLAGSVAIAGQGYRGPPSTDRGESHSDNRGHNDGNRHDDNRGDNRGNWGQRDHGGDWNRGHERRDWNGGHREDDHRNWGDHRNWDDHRGRNRGWEDHRRWDDHRWEGARHDYQPPRYYAPPRYYVPAPRYYSPPSHYYGPRERYYWGSYYRPHGWYRHSWVRGERLPYGWYEPRYVVYDYGRCGLRAPPYGYHWVRVDTDVVLAAVATGVILDVIYNQFD